MNEPEDDVHVLDAEERDFLEAMDEAYEENASIQVFRNLIQEAPVVHAESYYWMTYSFAIPSPPRLDVLRLLLEHEPEIAKHKEVINGHEQTLLWGAIMSGASVEAVELILDANPEAIFEAHLLHTACYAGRPIEMIRILLSRNPGAASIPGAQGMGTNLPIHNAADEDIFSILLDAFPGAASVQGNDGVLPLHIACRNNFSIELVKRLVEIHPEGLLIQNDGGDLPLHYACTHSTFEIIKFLLDKHPEGIRARNNDGELPLHRTQEIRVIQYLIDLYPEAVNLTDNHGNLPLHIACFTKASHDVIQLLLDGYTGDDRNHCGLSVANNHGGIPLHCYCSIPRDAQADVLQHLIDLYPQGIHITENEQGLLPLHAACQFAHHMLDVVRQLVREDPFTVVQNSQFGTPYQMVCSWQNRNVEIEAFLLEKQNEAVAALKEACDSVVATQLGLPDLVVALVWCFVQPDLWTADA